MRPLRQHENKEGKFKPKFQARAEIRSVWCSKGNISNKQWKARKGKARALVRREAFVSE